uniref:Uncharacterized protein n=1 Tax=Oryza glumipatula TaxID=40148 RepID=A0A0D9Y8B0_9ORYZ
MTLGRGLAQSGMNAATNTAAATFSGSSSAASATLMPPRLCPTSTARSPPPPGSARTASSNGRDWRASAPDAARSGAWTRWPAARSIVATLYQHHPPWPMPCTRMRRLAVAGTVDVIMALARRRLNLQHVTSLHKISSEYPVIIDDYQAGSIQNMIHCHRVKPKFRR